MLRDKKSRSIFYYIIIIFSNQYFLIVDVIIN